MEHDRQRTDQAAYAAFVAIVGRLAQTPKLSELPNRGGHFCEVDVDIDEGTVPVRFVGPLAEQIAQWQEGCEVCLSGAIKRHRWASANGQRLEKLVVVCENIRRTHTPLAEKTVVRET